jgi:hypothetical protein
MEERMTASVQHAVRLIWFAIVLHAGSSVAALTGLMAPASERDWLLVCSLAIVVPLIPGRRLRTECRLVRWRLRPAALLVAPIVSPRLLRSADRLTLSVALLQGVVPAVAAGFAVKPPVVVDGT